MDKNTLLKAIDDGLERGGEIQMTFEEEKQEEAEKLISVIASKLSRTYQQDQNEGTHWYEVVTHNNDRIEATVFFEKED